MLAEFLAFVQSALGLSKAGLQYDNSKDEDRSLKMEEVE